jgi:hypothetical protein
MRTMKVNENKSKTFLALLLVFAIAASTFAILPSAVAHDPAWQIPTYAFMSVSPVTVGVNEPTLIIIWLNTPPPTAEGPWGDRWDGYTVDITKPDGSQETLGPFTSDPIGSYATQYTPNQVGTYTFVFKFAGDILTGEPFPTDYDPYTGYVGLENQIFGYDNINDTYSASQSDPVTLVVQQQPLQTYQETPLPTDFWARPINGANRQWSAVVANWLGGAAQNVGPTERFNYGTGPESAHVMWTRQYWAGGVMDARFSDAAYYTGQSYEGYWADPIILNGKLYYNVLTAPKYGWYCVDLYTGETDYFHNTTGDILTWEVDWNAESGALQVGSLSFAQILDFESPNQHGGFPYLWSTPRPNQGYVPSPQENWMMYDAFTGNYMCSIANVSDSGTQVYGKDGSILYYNIAGQKDPDNPWGPETGPFYLTCWNSTRAIWYEDPWVGVSFWLWRPYLNQTFDGNNGFSLNVSVPELPGDMIAVREGQYIIGGTSGKNNGTYTENGNLWAISLKSGEEGKLLWNIEFTPPEGAADSVNSGFYGAQTYIDGPIVDPEDGIFVFRNMLTRQWYGFSLETGQLLWGPTESEQAWGFYAGEGVAGDYQIYNGKLLSAGYSGVLVAYDIKTGQKLWSYEAAPEGFESYYPYKPKFPGCNADGKINLYSEEHSPSTPLRRDAYLWCINVADGQLVWKLPFWGSAPAIADGYLIDLNLYDNQIYCFGKGPSTTTVSTPDTAVPLGTQVLIKGTVTDQTPSDEAKGTPAISDADQEAWMAYLYQQRPMPTDATGVPVKVTAVDAAGNVQDVGTVTSDSNGNFGITWNPTAAGTYKIVATFEGSKSYGGSSASSYLAVATSASPSVTATPVATTPSPSIAPQPNSSTPTTTYIAIAAAVVIIAVAIAAVALKRRK